MPVYALLFIAAIISILLIYLGVIASTLSIRRKILVLCFSFTAALLTYFGARDLLGRADPYPRPGKYDIRFAEKNKKDGKIYVYVTGKRHSHNFTPRLIIIDPEKLNGSASAQDIAKMLEIGQEGQGQLQLEMRQNGSLYGDHEYRITIQDPLQNFLPPKEH